MGKVQTSILFSISHMGSPQFPGKAQVGGGHASFFLGYTELGAGHISTSSVEMSVDTSALDTVVYTQEKGKRAVQGWV